MLSFDCVVLNSSKTASQILDQQLSDYFDLSVSSRPGFTTFINHATGNVVEVNDKKFATDKKYFTEVEWNSLPKFRLLQNWQKLKLPTHNGRNRLNIL